MSKSTLIKAGLFTLACLPILSQATTAPASQATSPANQGSQSAPNLQVSPGPVIINNSTTPNKTQTTTSATSAAPSTTTTTTDPTAATAAAAAAAAQTNATTPAPGQTTNTTNASTNTLTNPTTQSQNLNSTNNTQPASTATTPLDCNYHIPATTSTIDNNLVLQWGQKAAQQTFTFEPSTLDSQLALLKSCYTEQGWQSFNDALQKSGNLDAIKKENLTVSSMIDGQATITSNKNNQWKINVPIQVVYQNGKEKIVQSLSINLTVSRKVSGDLGVMQIVAMPRDIGSNNETPTTSTTDAGNANPAPAVNNQTPAATPSTPAAATPAKTTP